MIDLKQKVYRLILTGDGSDPAVDDIELDFRSFSYSERIYKEENYEYRGACNGQVVFGNQDQMDVVLSRINGYVYLLYGDYDKDNEDLELLTLDEMTIENINFSNGKLNNSMSLDFKQSGVDFFIGELPHIVIEDVGYWQSNGEKITCSPLKIQRYKAGKRLRMKKKGLEIDEFFFVMGRVSFNISVNNDKKISHSISVTEIDDF
jgi:hypothetical protein